MLIGDASGKMSSASVLRLDSLTQQELWIILSSVEEDAGQGGGWIGEEV